MAALWWISLLQVVVVINCLRLTEVRIPNHTVRHTNAHLECHYDLDGEVLYSVKWYKDGNEFYRYVPRDMPPVLIFNQTGVTVDLHNSTDALVVLNDVSLQSSGRYRCEVSGEAPSFQTVSDHGDMVVVALPEEGPKITGGSPRYLINEWVHVNCSSGRSKPATQLSWYINGEEVLDRNMLLQYPPLVTGREGLETSTLGLKFQVRHRHFKKGDMKLKCLATIASVYWRSNEESVETERQTQAPPREYSDTILSNSRVDKVHAPNSSLRSVPNLLIILLSFIYSLSGRTPTGFHSITAPTCETFTTTTRSKGTSADRTRRPTLSRQTGGRSSSSRIKAKRIPIEMSGAPADSASEIISAADTLLLHLPSTSCLSTIPPTSSNCIRDAARSAVVRHVFR